VADAPPPPSPSERAGRTLGSIRDAFNVHDAGKVAEHYTADCSVDTYTGPVIHGREELTTALEKTFAAFEDVKAMPLRGWVKGNAVASEVAWTGTMTGEFMGIKASRRPVGLIALRVMHLTDDGQVKDVHEYADAEGLVAQMIGKRGAPPPPLLPTNDLDLHAAKGTPDEDELASWARGIDEAFAEGDPKAVADAMAEGADYWTNFGGPAVSGRRAIEKNLAAWFKSFPDQKWEATDAWGVDGFAIIEHTMTATQKGAFGGHPASKKPVTGWRRVDILQPAVEGTVLHGWGFANVMEMLQQTGALKQPADLVTTHHAPAVMHKGHEAQDKSASPALDKK
jgi:ketosteroid isomerase-like protein